MYKLYGFVDDEKYGRRITKIIESNIEYDIVKAIDEDIRTTEIIHYLIIKRENNQDEYYMSINCYEDFIDYLDYFRRNNKNERR